MNRKNKVLIALPIFAMFPLAAFAFTALTVTATANFTEPLSISSASGDAGVICALTTPMNAACSVTGFAGDIHTLSVIVANAANAPVTVSATAISTSANVTVTSSGSQTVAAAGTTTFTFSVAFAQSTPTPATAIVSLAFSR